MAQAIAGILLSSPSTPIQRSTWANDGRSPVCLARTRRTTLPVSRASRSCSWIRSRRIPSVGRPRSSSTSRWRTQKIVLAPPLGQIPRTRGAGSSRGCRRISTAAYGQRGSRRRDDPGTGETQRLRLNQAGHAFFTEPLDERRVLYGVCASTTAGSRRTPRSNKVGPARASSIARPSWRVTRGRYAGSSRNAGRCCSVWDIHPT